jgi:hypothetical protein
MTEYIQSILIEFLSLCPLGFFGIGGILGGLLGGGMLGGKGGGGGQQTSPGPSRAPTTSAVEQEPQEQARQTKPQQQPIRQPQQPAEKSALSSLADQVAEARRSAGVEDTKAKEAEKVTDGLLDPVDPMPDSPEPQKGELLEAQDVVNRTDTDTPTARPQEEMFGEVPQVEKPEGVENQLFDAGTNEQPFEFQSGLPDRDLSGTLSDSEYAAPQGYSYKQTSTVQGGLPARRYGIRG